MTLVEPVSILFDTNHGEEVTPNEMELTQFVTLLESNGFHLETTTAPFSAEVLKNYQIIVIGNPLNSKFSRKEISSLKNYLQTGNGLLLISGANIFGKGGDAARNSNLNEITKEFFIEFSKEAIGHISQQQSNSMLDPSEPLIAAPSAQHPIVEGINQLTFISGTSIMAEETSSQLFRVTNIPGSHTIVSAVEAGAGRILAMGGSTPFFNQYLHIPDHQVFTIQVFRWLAKLPLEQPINQLKMESLIQSTEAPEAIQELRDQLNNIERELDDLKSVIKTTLEEMQQIIQDLKKEKKSS